MTEEDHLLDRITTFLQDTHIVYETKNMFGGHCFMVDNKMCFGTYKGGLMARVDPKEVDILTNRTGAEKMIHAGRPMTGYLMIQPAGYERDEDLEFWIRKCLEFNPKAKSSKKK